MAKTTSVILITKTTTFYLLTLQVIIISLCFFTKPIISSSATDSFIYGGCSNLKFTPNSPYESNVNSALTSLVNSAMSTNYNNFTTQGLSQSSSDTTVYSLFQCRGDLTNNGDCARCVAKAVSQLGTLCLDSVGGVLQLDGCFVKYDNSSFLGVEDKSEMSRNCAKSISYDSDELTRREAVLGFLSSDDGTYKPYRVAESGGISGVAQCTGDLSASECQDCLSEAIARVKTECGGATWGDLFLGKCYARYSEGGSHSSSSHRSNEKNDGDISKTLAIIIGLIAAVAILIIFLSCLRKLCDKAGRGGK